LTSAQTCAEVCRNPGVCGGTNGGISSEIGGTSRYRRGRLTPSWQGPASRAKQPHKSMRGRQPRRTKAGAFANFLPTPSVFDCDNCGHCDNRMDIGFACPQFVRSRAKSADKFKCKSGFLHISGHSPRKSVHARTHYRTSSKPGPLAPARGSNYPHEKVRREYL